MNKRNVLFSGLLSLLMLLFGFGVWRLFQIRFATGDIYPEYSTLRSDPLGAKAYVESLSALGLPVARNYTALNRLRPPAGSRLVFFGVPVSGLEERSDGTGGLEQLAEKYPLTISLAPVDSPLDGMEAGSGRSEEETAPAGGPAPEEEREIPGKASGETGRGKMISLAGRWGLTLDYFDGDEWLEWLDEDGIARAEAAPGAPAGLPAGLPWRSCLILKPVDPAWQVLYRLGGEPVALTRPLPGGQLVLLGDSYAISNEAMFRHREPAFLAWLAGAGTPLIFDETHLGVEEHPGVAALGRRFGLQWLPLALLLVAALYLWKNAVPMLPRRPAGDFRTAAAVTGEAGPGLASLLQRFIPLSELAATCAREWRRPVKTGTRLSASQIREIEELLTGTEAGGHKEKAVVARYLRAARRLQEFRASARHPRI